MREIRDLRAGWELAAAPPGGHEVDLASLDWSPAQVPGTVAAAIDPLKVDPDALDWWFRTSFELDPLAPGETQLISFGGIATIADVFLNGASILQSRSMFEAHRVDVSSLVKASNELVICCRALTPELAKPRRPRARWRTALVDGGLRFHRTMLIGRAPGFAPGPAVVGPWRAVCLERRSGFLVDQVALRPTISGDTGRLAVRLCGQRPRVGAAPAAVTVRVSGHGQSSELELELLETADGCVASGELVVPAVQRWWPHTHGEPLLYDLEITADGSELHRGRVGFRSLEWPQDWETTGLSLRVNGASVFARGAVWTPLDLSAPDQPPEAIRAALEQVREAGMNIVRIPGIGCYESAAFHELCDELGILVWQDFMLANLDYPVQDPDWRSLFEAEVREQLSLVAGRPSLAVLCGGSEVAQQVAMLGLDPELGRGELYTEILPRLVEESGAAVPYVPNSPWGGARPFSPDRGVANYYGVGAYLRDLTDARLAEVKFAAECLAFSNVPDEVTDTPGMATPHGPAWKAGVPRDAGAGWDFEDVRDHYLELVYDEDPVSLRWADPHRYLELSRSVSGVVMSETFGEWRREESTCSGALVLWLRDLRPGPGWGIVDHTGRPKVAYHHLRRALAPVTVWMTDEGLRGIAVHLANDRSDRLDANLRVALYRQRRTPVEQVSVPVSLEPHSHAILDVEALIGRFVDVGYSYRFGPPGHDAVVASLELGPEPGAGLIANAFRFPVGRRTPPETAEQLGLEARLLLVAGGAVELHLRSAVIAEGVRVAAAGFVPSDDAFTLEPDVTRVVTLRPSTQAGATRVTASISALNMIDRLSLSAQSD